MVDEGLWLGFGPRDGLRIGFEVEAVCREKNSPVQCGVEFNGSSLATKMGPHTRGKFPANPDIAGIGVLASLVCIYGIILALAVAVVLGDVARRYRSHSNPSKTMLSSNSRLPPLIRGVAFAVGDFALLLGWGYIVSFLLASKCSLSYYHYYIVLDVSLVFLSAIIISTHLVRRHYWRTWLWIPRIIGTLALITLLLTLLIYQHRLGLYPEWSAPGGDRTDSAILLPAPCFLDPDLVDRDNPLSQGRGALTDPDELARLGDTSSMVLEIALLAVLVLFFITTHLGIVLHAKRQGTKVPLSGVLLIFRCIPLGIHIAFGVVCFFHIFSLRSWIHASGWMTDLSVAEEGDPYDLGQLLPLLGILTIVVAGVEAAKAQTLPKCQRCGKETLRCQGCGTLAA